MALHSVPSTEGRGGEALLKDVARSAWSWWHPSLLLIMRSGRRRGDSSKFVWPKARVLGSGGAWEGGKAVLARPALQGRLQGRAIPRGHRDRAPASELEGRLCTQPRGGPEGPGPGTSRGCSERSVESACTRP